MTLEKAIELKAAVGRLMYSNNKDVRDYNALIDFIESALRPVSRERVEQIKGVWIFNDDWWEFRCSECHKGIGNIEKYKFCPHCSAPMTDDAVQMVMERLEALHESRNRH